MRSVAHESLNPESPSASKRADMSRILGLVESGLSIGESLRMVGRNRMVYEKWREREPDWAARVTAAAGEGSAGALDFVKFRKVMFDRDTPPHHLLMIEAMERAQPDSISLVLAWPEAAKTSLVTDRICWRLADNPDDRIAVISEGQDLARKIINHVAMRMTDREQFGIYLDRYGPFKTEGRVSGKGWNADWLTVAKAQNDEKEPSLEARGAGSTLYGGRYDWMVGDDIQSDRNIEATSKLLRYIRQTMLTRATRGEGRTLFVGSRVGPGDIYQTMLDEGMVDQLVKLPAVDRWVDRDEHFTVAKKGSEEKIVVNPDCPAKPTWDYWSLEDLAKRRKKVGEDVWARTYMQRQVSTLAPVFTEQMLETAKDRTRKRGQRDGVDVWCSVDPALDSGVCAFTAVAHTPQKMWVLDILERRDIYRYEDIFEQIGQWSVLYRPSRWIVEQNNFQKGLHQDDRMLALSSKFRFDAYPHQTSRNKNDPVMGVAMMASSFADQEISIPWADDAAAELFGALVDELRDWRPKRKDIKQDLVMALWFVWLAWESERQTAELDDFALWRPTWMRTA